jgi:hypothetical protein
MTRVKNRGLVYLRRSTDKQEISLPRQLDWAITAARQHAVALDADPTDLDRMQSARLSSLNGIRLDDGISGFDLSRPGFLAFNHDAVADPTVSHVFFLSEIGSPALTTPCRRHRLRKNCYWPALRLFTPTA